MQLIIYFIFVTAGVERNPEDLRILTDTGISVADRLGAH